jgi:hypothetical protein
MERETGREDAWRPGQGRLVGLAWDTLCSARGNVGSAGRAARATVHGNNDETSRLFHFQYSTLHYNHSWPEI